MMVSNPLSRLLVVFLAGVVFCLGSFDDAAAKRKNKKKKKKTPIEAPVEPKPESVAESFVKEIAFTAKELSFQERNDEKSKREHERKLKDAGLDGKDPLKNLARHLALGSLTDQFERKWGDGVKAENSKAVTLRVHISGKVRSDLSDVSKITSALETVYGGAGKTGRFCIQANGQDVGSADVNLTSLRAIKKQLGLSSKDMTAIRVITGQANGEPIKLREGQELTTEQFNMLSTMIEKGRPIVVRFAGGLKGADEKEKEEAKEVAKKAKEELAEGPKDGVLVWADDAKSWSFKYRPAESKSLAKLKKLMDKVTDVELTDAVITKEFREFVFRPGKAKGWHVQVVPYNAKNGIVESLLGRAKMNYGYTVNQNVDDCAIKADFFLKPIAIKYRPEPMRVFREIAGFKLVNLARQKMLVGYQEPANCTSSIPTPKRPVIDNANFDKLLTNASVCKKLCPAASRAAAPETIFSVKKCNVDCVESTDYRQCLGAATRILSGVSVQSCQDAL